MVNFKLAKQIENLEKELQTIKWAFLQPYPRKQIKSPARGIVQETSGLFSKTFPKGTLYEKMVRKTWEKRIKSLGI